MNVNQKEIKKYMYLISFAGVVLAIILNLSQVFHFIQTIWKLIVPFLVGFCIAFVLSIITKQLENTLLKNSKNKRMFSFILTLILLFAFIILICFIVGPELVHSIKEIIRLAPNAYDQFIQTLKDNRNIMNGSFKNMIDSIISLDIDLSSLYKTIVNNWNAYSILTGCEQGHFQFVVELPAHHQSVHLSQHDIHGQKHLGALHQVAAVGVAVPVAEAHVHVQVGVALVVVADDARAAGQLNGAGEMQHLAVAVARLGRQFHGVAVAHAVQRADGAEDHAVVDACPLAGLRQSQKDICTGLQPQCDDPAQTAFRHFHFHIRSTSLYSKESIRASGRYYPAKRPFYSSIS